MSYSILTQRPDFPIVEEWVWETDIAVSYNGTEDRTPLLRYPKRSFQGTISFSEKRDLQRHLAMMTKRFKAEFGFPLFQYGVKLKAGVTTGATSLPASVARGNFAVGDTAVVIEGSKTETVVVDSVSANALGLAAPLVGTFTSRAYVCPLATVYSAENANVTRKNSNGDASSTFTFTERVPRRVVISALNEAELFMFDGLPLLPFWPSGNSFDHTLSTGIQNVDYLAEGDVISPWTFTQWNATPTFMWSDMLRSYEVDLATNFPILKQGEPGYPDVGEFYPASLQIGPLNANAKIQAGKPDGTGWARPDDAFYFNDVQFGGLAEEFAGGTVLYNLPAGNILNIKLLNLAHNESGIGGDMSVVLTPNMDWWQLFADTIQGSLNPFLFATNREDMTIVTPAAPGGAAVTVFGDEYSQHYWGHDAFSRIFIDSDAGRHYAKITAISAIGGNDRLTFSPALPNGAGWSQNQKIGFLLKVRNGNDKISFSHYGLHTEVSLSLRTVI